MQTAQLEGKVRPGRNWSPDSGIHDDATATKLGFRGGTVAGSIHMNEFAPVLVEGFGREWFETGWLSLYFQNATVDGEEVQVRLDAPRTWMVRASDDMVVADGTAGLGDSSQATLQTRDLRPSPSSELRMFKDIGPGYVLGEKEVKFEGERQGPLVKKGFLTEPSPGWYTDSSPWGGPIASPSSVVQLLWGTHVGALHKFAGDAVGLFGAIEIAQVKGPVLLGSSYNVQSEVVAVGQSPKTEYCWFDSVATDPDGQKVATMRMLLRWMKASSPLYAS
jgi:hypothetical protein